jgi:hypothetical protein
VLLPGMGTALTRKEVIAMPYYGDHESGDYDPDEWDERVNMFADPGGHSALRRAHPGNPRNLPCPRCGTEDVLTPEDVAHHYVCDRCADMAEGRIPQW